MNNSSSRPLHPKVRRRATVFSQALENPWTPSLRPFSEVVGNPQVVPSFSPLEDLALSSGIDYSLWLTLFHLRHSFRPNQEKNSFSRTSRGKQSC